jgi:heme/copper-type cytochrome/quinol oxidase subunit 2
MRQKRNTIPSVLLAILSTLGVLIGLLVIGVLLANSFLLQPEIGQPLSANAGFSNYSIIFLALATCVVNTLTLISSVQYLRKKQSTPLSSPNITTKFSVFGFWILSLIAGHFASQSSNWRPALALVTTVAVSLPIILLIMLARSGLQRSTRQRELGAITMGLTISPFLIIIFETILILLVVVTVFILIGMQNQLPQQIPQLIESLSDASGGIEQLESVLFDLMKEPIIALAIFLSLGVIAPMIEEIFKPMVIWFLLNRPLQDHEGYALGLISGGAFALLESAGMVIQMTPQDWLAAVVLRAATGVLHIGLSGLVGFGLVRSKKIHKFERGFLFILLAGALHGAWNSLAIYSGLTALPALEDPAMYQPNLEVIISVALMVMVFFAVVTINIFINRFIKRNTPEQSSLQNLNSQSGKTK